MGETIKIDKEAFSERLSSFYTAWKADKRTPNGVFGSANSIVILMGKAEETNSFQKNNAMHVSALGILSVDVRNVAYRLKLVLAAWL